MTRLRIAARHMVASFIRAEVAIISATQGLNAFDARGWRGVLTATGVALIPPALVFAQTFADQLDNKE